MKKFEAQWTSTVFMKYLDENPMNAPWEVKHSRGKDSVPFSAIEDHQIRRLHQARLGGNGLNWKISDDSRGQKMFDGISYYHVPFAPIIVVFPTLFCFIDILIWEKEERTSPRRSLTESRAEEIAQKVIHFTNTKH